MIGPGIVGEIEAKIDAAKVGDVADASVIIYILRMRGVAMRTTGNLPENVGKTRIQALEDVLTSAGLVFEWRNR